MEYNTKDLSKIWAYKDKEGNIIYLGNTLVLGIKDSIDNYFETDKPKEEVKESEDNALQHQEERN